MKLKSANRINSVEEYYFSRKLKEIKLRIENGEDIINLGIGSPDMDPDISIIEATNKSIVESGNHNYQSYNGSDDFRMAISKWYKKFYSVDLDYNTEILPLMGSKEGIMHVSMAFLNYGDKVLIPDPGYPTYISVTKLVGAKPIIYNLSQSNNWYPDIDELEKLDLTDVKLMWVNYPNMPTGADASIELFEQLVKFGLKHNILIVNDNPYSFILNDNPFSIMKINGADKTAIELNSLSKSFNMAGWRVGMVVGSSKLLQSILKVKSNMDSGMFLPIQKGAIAALNLKEDWFEKLNNIYFKRRELVFQILDIIDCSYDKNAVGMFVWGRSEIKNTDNLSEELLNNAGLFITPGSVFGENGREYLRISLCTSCEVLNNAIKKLKMAGYGS